MRCIFQAIFGTALLVFILPVQAGDLRLGLADNPHDNTLSAIMQTWEYIGKDANMVVYHEDREGIPWTEALWGLPYPTKYSERINFRLSMQATLPPGHKRYLALTPLNFVRRGISPQYEAASNSETAAFWAAQTLNSDFVKLAYYNHIERLISIYQPDYLAYAVEANLLINFAPEQWAQFVELMQFIYPRIKHNHPDLPLMITIQAEGFYDGFKKFPENPFAYAAYMSQIFPYTDYMAVSSYPYMKFKRPWDLPADYFSAIAKLTPDKPFAIAETGWPAESLEPPYNVKSNVWNQYLYHYRILADVQQLQGKFVNLLLPRDYDALWEKIFKDEPDAALLRLWRDMGLYDGAGNPRPAIYLWQTVLNPPPDSKNLWVEP